MMETILFVVSATSTILYFVGAISCFCGHSMSTPAPILHVFDIGFTHTYISTPSLAYQVYFWANKFGIFVA